ncbi:hypothetical protein D3C71_1632220 [compost metagenome]
MGRIDWLEARPSGVGLVDLQRHCLSVLGAEPRFVVELVGAAPAAIGRQHPPGNGKNSAAVSWRIFLGVRRVAAVRHGRCGRAGDEHRSA